MQNLTAEPDVVKTTRRLLVKLFGSQMEAARKLRFHERTVRWWCQHGAPPHVLHALKRHLAADITLPTARRWMRNKRTRRTINGGRA